MEMQLRAELMGQSGNTTYQTNHLIEAGAGAGKTETLVNRIANQLTNTPCKSENIAVITFTNKATEEMRSRLDKLLHARRSSVSDPEEKQRLDNLIRDAGRMQISTIHSFCKTMLESLPFESGLGTEMTFLEDETSACKAFWEQQYRENRSLFTPMEALYVNCRHLAAAFAELCAIGDGTIIYVSESSSEITTRKQNLVKLMTNLHQSLPQKLNVCTQAQELLDSNVQQLLSMSLQDFTADDENSFRLAALVSMLKHPLKKYGSEAFLDLVKAKKDTKNATLKEQWKAILDEWNKAKANAETAAKELLHSRCMPIMLKLVQEYQQEKRKQHLVSSRDLLIFTRDMLRDNQEARKILHDRYRVLYVDEFQDTDSIQAQILFYLTTDEKDFNKDWKQCKPAPGSLFLVGDPKQAIYRFCGADIDVYKEVENLFRKNNNEIGQIEHLKLNFRSAEEICKLSKNAFGTGNPPTPIDETNTVTTQLDGNYYQASFADMKSKKGSSTLARTLRYEPMQGSHINPEPIADEKKANDAHRIAVFIKKMVDDQVQVGVDAHTVTYKDFLILPPGKEAVTFYATHLIAEGIPVNITGKQVFNEIEPIHRLLIHLQSLASPGNDFALGRVLVLCYGVKLPAIRRFMQQAKIRNISSALSSDKIDALWLAFSAANPQDSEVLDLCAILRELNQLRDMAQTAPALAVIEKLLDGGYNIWEDCNDQTRRRREYAYVQQFLQLLRRAPTHNLSALAAIAEEYGEREVEHELSLVENTDAVRIMNVHKSKGLEGEIVILPYANTKAHSPTHHTRRAAAGERHEYCLYTKKGKAAASVFAQPLNWEIAPTGGIPPKEREKRYQEAERIRLLYVAATRAKSMLLVCDQDNKNNGYWKPIALACDAMRGDDPAYGPQFKCLLSAFALPAAQNSTPSAATLPQAVDTHLIEANLKHLAQAHLSQAQYTIAPSRLDHQSRTATKRKDRDDDTQPTGPQSDAADISAPDTAEAEKFSPHGPDWGTIVHRIMELAVRTGKFDKDSRAAFARQAVLETLPNEFLTKGQRKMLFEDPENIPENWVDTLSQAATQASAFLEEENSQLRELLAGAKCYPELPFILREEEKNKSALYRHLSSHIDDVNAQGKNLDVQGVIDLAIWKDGEWTVVDYKTDRLHKDESQDGFKKSLCKTYTAQIASYAQVLERLNIGKATCAYLCSIPLGGELIKLDLPEQ